MILINYSSFSVHNFSIVIFFQLLSSSVELISDQLSPFVNLKSLKICPANLDSEEQPQNKEDMSSEVKNYLLDSSPNATVTMYSREVFRP